MFGVDGADLLTSRFDSGNSQFELLMFAIIIVDVGNLVGNVILVCASVKINIRFNIEHSL